MWDTFIWIWFDFVAMSGASNLVHPRQGQAADIGKNKVLPVGHKTSLVWILNESWMSGRAGYIKRDDQNHGGLWIIVTLCIISVQRKMSAFTNAYYFLISWNA
jgi:hypothetical protein